MKSSWIASIAYKKLDDGSSYLVLFLKDQEKHCGSCGGRGYVPSDDPFCKFGSRACRDCFRTGRVQVQAAILYGPKLPSWLPGLVQAGTGGKSVGHAYHKLLRGKYPSQRVEGREQVQQLRQLMGGIKC